LEIMEQREDRNWKQTKRPKNPHDPPADNREKPAAPGLEKGKKFWGGGWDHHVKRKKLNARPGEEASKIKKTARAESKTNLC